MVRVAARGVPQAVYLLGMFVHELSASRERVIAVVVCVEARPIQRQQSLSDLGMGVADRPNAEGLRRRTLPELEVWKRRVIM